MKETSKWKIAGEFLAVLAFAYLTYDFATRWSANKEKKVMLVGVICFALITLMRAIDLWGLITKKNRIDN